MSLSDHLSEEQLLAVRKVMIIKILTDAKKVEAAKKRKRPKNMWVNPFLSKRALYDIEETLLKDLIWGDNSNFKNFTRLLPEQFDDILNKVSPAIEKEDTQMRFAISPRVKLAITLRYIATGDSYRSLEVLSRISKSTISLFVPEVLKVIYETLQPIYLKAPNTIEEWKDISNDFDSIWNFPHTLGAIDGKHFRIVALPNEGSNFYNYKGFHSVIMLAAVDAHCRFLFIDVGANGRASDSTIFKNSYLYKSLKTNALNIPEPAPLSEETTEIPYFFVADDAFQLDKNIMKPYSRCISLSTRKKVYNYRLCRARMTVECAFGRLVSSFRIFHRPIEVKLSTVDLIIKTCCVLHNYKIENKCSMISKERNIFEDLVADTFPETVVPLESQFTGDIYRFANKIQEKITDYLIGPGDLSFQWKKIGLELEE